MFGLVRQMLEDDDNIAGAIAGMRLLAFVYGKICSDMYTLHVSCSVS